MTWISVNDKLPENNQYTLCWDGKDVYLLKFYRDLDKRHKKPSGKWESSDECLFFDDIQYWMPLPNAPTKEN